MKKLFDALFALPTTLKESFYILCRRLSNLVIQILCQLIEKLILRLQMVSVFKDVMFHLLSSLASNQLITVTAAYDKLGLSSVKRLLFFVVTKIHKCQCRFSWFSYV